MLKLTRHLIGVFILITIQIYGLNADKNDVDNRELLNYLMQATSTHAFSSQLPPGYNYNAPSNQEENQLELPVTSSSNLTNILNDGELDQNQYLTTRLNKNNYLLNHHSPNLNISSKSVNLTRFISNEDDNLINTPMQNKQAKSSDQLNNNGQPLQYLHHHSNLPVSKLYRMANHHGRGLDSSGWRREPFSSRTVSSLFGRPRKSAFSTAADLMKSAADIPTPSASYYTTTDGTEIEDPSAQITLTKSAALRSAYHPMYHQASNYGQYYAEDPRQAHYYHQIRDYYDPHGHDMTAYSKSDFYWLIPIAFLIGAGALLLPIISVFMTTLVTSGTLTLNAGRRRKRNVDFLVGELRHLIGEDAYVKLEDMFTRVQKAIDKLNNNNENNDKIINKKSN